MSPKEATTVLRLVHFLLWGIAVVALLLSMWTTWNNVTPTEETWILLRLSFYLLITAIVWRYGGGILILRPFVQQEEESEG